MLSSDVPARHQAPQGARNAVADGPAHGLVGAAPATFRAARVRRRLGELGRLRDKNQMTTPDSLSSLMRQFFFFGRDFYNLSNLYCRKATKRRLTEYFFLYP
jgi:hypothetical protein